MLYFKRKIASHWKLLLLMIGICAVSLYCIIDLVIWSDGYAIENLFGYILFCRFSRVYGGRIADCRAVFGVPCFARRFFV